ncbi:hypothetical protein GR226_04215 [Rhizobium leguminosarum]|uniref:hypothetical protein n=1 Tax=Rhizobium ruizarguesonis TaxID=2081791 RepID=UPI0013DA42DC|nr:hypothetical protein [Rhizobium ruizarguesonis]NEH82942.1 hypothetical protein [Rhizobium ruizarguesonis]
MTDVGGATILWRSALADWAGDDLLFDENFFGKYGDRTWPLAGETPDRLAAHALHVELVSRITTQPLGYSEGSEASALKSVYSLFAVARELTKKSPEASSFETIVWHVLNGFVRPFTAKWHLKASNGELRALDSSDVFRAELVVVQRRLIALDKVLGKIAGKEWYSAEASIRSADTTILAEMKKPVVWRPMGVSRVGLIEASEKTGKRDTIAQLASEEMASVKKRRDFYKVERNDWAAGIALSGGGIRSATFAMGVLVSLAKRDLLRQFDYLSTVSGGGYTGSFLTQLIGSPGSSPELNLYASKLPFKREEGESLLLQRIRQGASFLSGGAWERFALAMAQAQGIFINILMLVLLVSLVANIQILGSKVLTPERTPAVSAIFIAIFFAWALVVPVIRRMADKKLKWINRINAAVCAFLLVPPIWALLQGAANVAASARHDVAPDKSQLLGTAIVFLLTLGAVFSIACALFVGFSRIRPMLMATFTVVFVILSEGFLFQILDGLGTEKTIYALGSLIIVGLVVFCALNVNATSLHHYYKAKLSHAFLLDGKAEPAKPMKLSEFDPERAMFPIVNCALNVPGSTAPKMRGRNADLFSFTPVSAGANLIGFEPIAAWEKANPQLSLATAMALSGAAVSPQMGLRTTRYGSFWLTLLNLRLNFWLKKPPGKWWARYPNLWNLEKEISASASEKGAFVNISDGGHIENLGVYELLRRRCRFIVAVDGENDSQMTFHALTNLQRLAYIDHGIVIDANLEDLRLGEKGLSRSHFRFCRIRYPAGPDDSDEEIGYLVYLKLSLTGNEGEFIRRYKFDEPAFPHHSTANQFFTEVQFEAYRALGEHVGEKMFLPAITGFEDGSKDVLLESWFLGLGKSFLDPLPEPKPDAIA